MSFQIDPEFKSLIPALSHEEYSQLEQNLIKETSPDSIILLTWNGVLIDGHNRYEICTKHNIPFKTVEKNGFKDRDDAKVWIINNQLGRRNIPALVKIDLAYKKHDILDLRERARENIVLGGKLRELSKEPLKQPFATWQNPIPNKIDRVNTTKKIAEETKVSERTVSRGLQILKKAPEELKQKALKGEASINEVYKEIKKKEKEETLKQVESVKLLELPSITERYKIIHDDFRNAAIEPDSIDVIITDPPYPAEFLNLWQDMASFAKRVLKPSGFLIAYSGELHLHKVFEYLSKELVYYWTASLLHNGNTQIVHARNVMCQWKPILLFQKAPFKKLDKTFKDVLNGSGREKDNHKWQQAEAELSHLITTFSNVGDTILDPFAGSGTTLIAALKHDRKSIVIEKEAHNIEIIKNRVADVQNS